MSKFVQEMAITSFTRKPLALATAMHASLEHIVGNLILTVFSISFSKKTKKYQSASACFARTFP